MDSTFWDVSLAALIHDIGKLGQRAFPPKGGLSEQSRRMTEILCPKSGDPRFPEKQFHSHLHVLYTNEFLNLVENSLPECFDFSQMINLSARHHQPETDLQKLVTEADHLASAIERVNPPEYITPEGYSAYRKARLIPICGQIQLEHKNAITGSSCGHNVLEWGSDSSVLFPIENTPVQEAEWKSLWDSLLDRWKNNRLNDPWQYLTRALSDLEAFTWCVPAATNVFPDISLYDHSRAVSAIAGCIYKNEDKDNPFLLVTGDFGGIQKYMFDIKHGEEGSAKILRGRSFSVRLFVENVVFHILHKVQVPLSHRIMSAGGRMYLLLPNNEDCLNTLETTARELDAWSLETTNGQLRFNLGWVSTNRDGIKDFTNLLINVNEALDQQAKRPLSRSLIKQAWVEDEFLRPQVKLSDQIIEEEREMGQRLPKTAGVAFSHDTGDGINRFPFGRFDLIGKNETIPENSLAVLNWSELKTGNNDTVVRSRFARHVPVKSGSELLTFEDIANQAAGRSALGFVKADIDNLGFIISNGLKGSEGAPDRTSISHFATLSRALEGFFSGYVENLIEKRFPLMYLVYSGGDDLLAVGPWDQALDFIITLRKEFGRYVENNPDWGLSAGVLIGHSKTPILQAVDQADELLNKSKAPPKDKITIFNQTLNWADARKALDRGKRLLDWLSNGTVNVSQIRRLMTYSRMFDEYHRTGDTSNLRYVYLLIYDLKRNWKDKTYEEKEAKTWAQRLEDPSFKDLPALTLSCHYALYGV